MIRLMCCQEQDSQWHLRQLWSSCLKCELVDVGWVASFNPTFKPQNGLFVNPDCAGKDLCRLGKRKPTYAR